MLKYIITVILLFVLAVVICATWLASNGQLDIAAWKDIVGGAVVGGVIGSIAVTFIVKVLADE